MLERNVCHAGKSCERAYYAGCKRNTVKEKPEKKHRTSIAEVTKPGQSGLIPLRRSVVLSGARSLHCRTEKKDARTLGHPVSKRYC